MRIVSRTVLLSFALVACEDAAAPRFGEVTSGPAALPRSASVRPERLVFGFTPYLPEAQLRKEFTPLVEYLSREVDLQAELRIARDYAELLTWVRREQIHVAQLSPFNYVRAKAENPELVILVGQIAEGASSYTAYIVGREDAPFDSIEDLKGKRFAFVDRQSASGYLYPLAYLRSAGLDPATFFGQAVFAGNHTRLVEMVAKGEVDAGATYTTGVKIASIDHPEQRLKIIAKTGRVPYDAFSVTPRLEPRLVEDLRSALLALSTRDEEGRRILGGLTNINGFVTIGDDHFDEVRRVARLVEDAAAGAASP